MANINDFVTIETWLDTDVSATETSLAGGIDDFFKNHLLRSVNVAPDLKEFGVDWHTLQVGDVLVLGRTDHAASLLENIEDVHLSYEDKAYKVVSIQVHYVSVDLMNGGLPRITIQLGLKFHKV